MFVTHDVREAVCLGDRVLLMSPRPGHIGREFKISLPRPRDINSPALASLPRSRGAERGGRGLAMKRATHIVLFFGTIVIIWWLAVASGRWSPVILPSPASVADYLWSSTLDGSLLEATVVTVRRLLVGYLIGVAIGLPIGLLASRSQLLEDTVGSSPSGSRRCRASVGFRSR